MEISWKLRCNRNSLQSFSKRFKINTTEINPDSFSQSVPPDQFLLAIGAYVVIISAILTHFAGAIEYGGDRAQLKYDLACMLPITVLIFAVSAAAPRVVFSGMV